MPKTPTAQAKTVYVKGEFVMERYRCGVTILRPRNGKTIHKYTQINPEDEGWTRVAYPPW